MRYVSTRGGVLEKSFSHILLEGIAPDGGLYMPKFYPQIDNGLLQQWRNLSYPDLAFRVLSLYIDDIPAADLKRICAKTYTAETFGSEKIVPLRQLEDGLHLEALSHGPTLAFKDIAMQLLGNLFEYELDRRGAELNILGATSGDTGSAAEYAMRDKKGIRIFMTSPHGRMSPFQQAQMFSLQNANIFNIAIRGVFDDCQDIVKAVLNDHTFKAKHKIGTVNSINWARLLAQVVYYFAGYFQATTRNDQRVSFAVPSGNFGNACAGHVARQMGLPIDKLIVVTNENDVLNEFFLKGEYRVRSGLDTKETSSPSMDINKASNLERFVFDLLERNSSQINTLFGKALLKDDKFDLSADAHFPEIATRFGFSSGSCDHEGRLSIIRDVYRRFGVVIDPHTANGVKVAREQMGDASVPMIVLETAMPIKFAATIHDALGRLPVCPDGFQGLEGRPRRVRVMTRDVAAVKDLIAQICVQGIRLQGLSDGSLERSFVRRTYLNFNKFPVANATPVFTDASAHRKRPAMSPC